VALGFVFWDVRLCGLVFLLTLCFQGGAGDEDARGLRCWCFCRFCLLFLSVRSRWSDSVFLGYEGDGWCIYSIPPHTHMESIVLGSNTLGGCVDLATHHGRR
jgi:hypothetical protein